MNETMKEFALGMLAKQINDSIFEKLEVTKVNNGICVTMGGQTFGVIGALGAVVADLSSECGMPMDELTNFVRMAAEIISQTREIGTSKQFDSKEEMADFVKKFFAKEGDK